MVGFLFYVLNDGRLFWFLFLFVYVGLENREGLRLCDTSMLKRPRRPWTGSMVSITPFNSISFPI